MKHIKISIGNHQIDTEYDCPFTREIISRVSSKKMDL